MLTLTDTLTALTGLNLQTTQPQPITSVVIDSRQAEAGSLFVALPGENADGHQFTQAAFNAGAIAAIIDREVDADCAVVEAGAPQSLVNWQKPVCIKVRNSLLGLQELAAWQRRQFSPQVIGITGSVGKTSTKELAHSVLSQRFKTLKNKGNLNNEIGLPLTLLQLNNTFEKVVLEMGMYNVGEIKTLCQIAQPQIGVVTNIGPTHLERLGTMDNIVAAKQELVEALPEDGVAILNVDDPLVAPMRHHTRARVFTYGLDSQADLWADEIVSEGLTGVRFVFRYQGEAIHVKVPLLGRHSVHTALRAAAIGLNQGMYWDEIAAGLQDNNAGLRLVAVPGPRGSIILDDTYNASPASGIAALNLLDELNARRKIAVLGYMAELGSYEDEGHRKVGCRAADVVDMLIALDIRAKGIAEEAAACGLNAEAIHLVDSVQQALDILQNTAQNGDTILVKGSRSMEMEKIVAGLSVSAESN